MTARLAGKEGDKVQSRVIRERLLREAEGNVALKVTASSKMKPMPSKWRAAANCNWAFSLKPCAAKVLNSPWAAPAWCSAPMKTASGWNPSKK